MRETFTLSFIFCICMIFILGLKIKTVSAYGFNFKPKKDHLQIPAFGRTAYGIGSLYDGLTGNFLPPEFSVISEKSGFLLSPHVVNRTRASSVFNSHDFSLYRPSKKLQIVFEEFQPEDYDETMGWIFNNYNGLALRAVLGMLAFPENGTAGFIPDEITQQEMTETITNYTSSCSCSFEDALILYRDKTDHKLQLEIFRNLKKADMKILEKATHVVVKVIRGSKSVKSSTASSSRIYSDDPVPPTDLTSDSLQTSRNEAIHEHFANKQRRGMILSPATPGGVPLAFELMPVPQFLIESGLELPSSSEEKFKSSENFYWRNPMDILHGRTFQNLDRSWQLIRQMAKLNTTFHKCLQENPGKDVKKAGKMIQDLQNLYESFTETFATYKQDLKSLLEKSSTGTEQDKKLWDLVYEKPWGNFATGIHWKFYRNLEAAQEQVFRFGGYDKKEVESLSRFVQVLSQDAKGVEIGCDVIPELV